MVGKLTYGKRQWESLDAEMRQLIPPVDLASKQMIDYIDADTEAFNDYMVRIMKSYLIVINYSSAPQKIVPINYFSLFVIPGRLKTPQVFRQRDLRPHCRHGRRSEAGSGRSPGPGPQGRLDLGHSRWPG